MTQDDQGEPGEQQRRRDTGPHSQHAAARANRVNVRQRAVPQVGMRSWPGNAVGGRAGQDFPLFRERLPAQASLLPGGLQRGQLTRVPPDSGIAHRLEAGVGAAQIIDGRIAHAAIVELRTDTHLGTQVAGTVYLGAA